MSKITREQVEKINAKLQQGFELDVFYYLTHKEKIAKKRIEIGENVFATLELTFMPEYDNSKGYNIATGRQIPTCHISKQLLQGEFYVSHGLGKWIKIGEPQDKKLFSKLQKLSGTIDIEKMVAIAKGEPATLEESKPIFG